MAGWLCDKAAQKGNDWSLPNWSRYCNPIRRAVCSGIGELDPEKRTQLFVKMNELLIQDVAVIPLVKYAMPHAVGVDLKGYDFPIWM